MSKELQVHNKDGNFIYSIHIERDFSKLTQYIHELDDFSGRKVCVVTETTVGPLYLDQVKDLLSDSFSHVTSFIFKAGEASKNLDVVKELYTHLIEEHFDRNDLLIALGGGVTGDLTGYAAATYLRGIRFIQIPTSLLAQVDSSIGGKTGVDFDQYKNMVGAFHQPKLVYINLSTLQTLTKREFLSGMGEIIKHGLIKDLDYYNWLKEHIDQVKALDYDALEYMISVSCNIKRCVVENDVNEKGERSLLNFGHTLGHAIEKLMNFQLLHGECVSIGMVLACDLSQEKGLIRKEDTLDVIETLKAYELPVSFKGLDPKVIAETTLTDKKMDAGKVKFILLEGLGHGIIDLSIDLAMMEEECKKRKED